MNQLDGIKMFLLAIVGLAGAASAVLPRWLRYTGIALAVAMVCSGVPYLLLWSGGARRPTYPDPCSCCSSPEAASLSAARLAISH